MSTIDILNRPFATEIITGLMLPDGVFETTLGKQKINAQFKNTGASTATNSQIYIESVSNPGIVITPSTFTVASLVGQATRVLSWNADFTAAPPGKHFVSFIVQDASGHHRIIKQIFVTKVQFDPGTKTFSAETPEGLFQVRFKDLVGPDKSPCSGNSGPCDCCCKTASTTQVSSSAQSTGNIFNDIGKLYKGLDPNFKLCIRGYLPHELDGAVTYTPPFSGQYGDLPFQDPWWKIILCIIAVLLLIASAIAEAVGGTGDVGVSTTSGDTSSGSNCCGVTATGGGTNAVAAGLLAAAAAVATAAACSDERDPFRRGEDHTIPAAGELTTGETLHLVVDYLEPVAMGKPFLIGAKWEYTRITTGKTYTYAVDEKNNNVHVLSKYVITAPDVIRTYKEEFWKVTGEFYDKNGIKMLGDQLFVQCFLFGPNGELRSFVMQDDGIWPDDKPSDGVITGGRYFNSREKGLWTFCVIAQDINNAQSNLTPEQQAQIIGGMVLTNQLTISFKGGQCPLVPDGHVNVV